MSAVDVLALWDETIRDGIENRLFLKGSIWHDRMLEARAAVAELIAAAGDYFHGYCVDEAEETFAPEDGHNGFFTGCSPEQSLAAKRLRAALVACNGETEYQREVERAEYQSDCLEDR